jgi:KaiC/GvpD/RAD55 family RecA-like ATPase
MRFSTGVDGFDELVQGGLLEDRLYVLSGPPGSGKTTFSAQFVTQGAIEGQKSLFLTMHETKKQLADDMSTYGFGFERVLASDRTEFLNIYESKAKRIFMPRKDADFGNGVSNMTQRIVNFVNAQEIDRIVVDSTMILNYLYPDDSGAFMQFVSSLKQADATTILISEMTDPTSYADEHYLAHGVVFLHNYLEPTGMQRGLQVIKMRGTDIDSDIREIEFTDDGLEVHPDRKVQID